MATVKTHVIRPLLSALLLISVIGLLSGCSGTSGTSGTSDSTSATAATETPTSDAGQDNGTASTQDSSSDTNGTDVADAAAEPTVLPTPTLADDDVASSVIDDAGFQFEDEQGNLVAIYGVAPWPESFEALTGDARAVFPFSSDVADLDSAETVLVALDVAMCAAGIDGQGWGTAEFFVHDSLEAPLSSDPVLNRGLLSHHPIVQPRFELPTTAKCSRGWLPMLWRGTDTPVVARYVLTTRSSSSAQPERHVYQWDIDGEILELDAIEPIVDDVFDAGQTVTFNQGRLKDVTVTVDGWAELVGAASEFQETRTVAVSIEVCPATNRVPEFGLGVDGWNLIAPVEDQDLALEMQPATGPDAEPDASCIDGWLNFAVPFGAVPTSFFASDGAGTDTGYAEWSLVNAAIAAPQ